MGEFRQEQRHGIKSLVGDRAFYKKVLIITIPIMVCLLYTSWQESNEDPDLIGINKLEIGEIRTGGEGYYVLYRLTFAGADGTDVVKYETAYVIISQDTMVINEIKEEAL